MAKKELTDVMLRNLKVTARTEFTDTRQIGLEVHAYPTGKKTFSFRLRGPDGVVQRARLGVYPHMKLAEARALAADHARRVSSGEQVTAAAAKEKEKEEAEERARCPTLLELLREYEAGPGKALGIWARTKRGLESEAFKRIVAVYGALMDRKVTEITAEELSKATHNYKPLSGKDSATGQAAKARLYLKPVLDWAARRGRFRKLGACRPETITAPDLFEVADPSSDDPTITGARDRVLTQQELEAILPLLVWPAPECLGMRTPTEQDLRPIALRFLLLTGARLGELQAMRWSHFREDTGIWHKPVVKTLRGTKRKQNLPLSKAAIALLRSLPGYHRKNPKALVFPNSAGGTMGNFKCMMKAIFRESGTSGWHRHDLRRTLATYLKELGVPLQVIDEILAHKAASKDQNVSKALSSYLSAEFIGDLIPNPQAAALDRFAEVIARIEANATARAKAA